VITVQQLNRCSIKNNGNVSVAGNRHQIPKYRLPAVPIIGWHVARHWAAGGGGGALLFY